MIIKSSFQNFQEISLTRNNEDTVAILAHADVESALLLDVVIGADHFGGSVGVTYLCPGVLTFRVFQTKVHQG